MGKRALKKSVEQLQKLFDFLGEYGGTIETKKPENWWTLDLEVDSVEGEKKNVIIGVYKIINGDVVFDPKFELTLTVDGDTIKDADIIREESNGLLGSSYVDENDVYHGLGGDSQANPGLRTLFEQFMNNMTEVGPYLNDPKDVKKYDKPLDD
jgi:hypothetical protein